MMDFGSWTVPKACFVIFALSRVTVQYELQCYRAGDPLPDRMVDQRVYPTLTDVCGDGAGFECTHDGSLISMFTRAVTNRNLYLDYRNFCSGHCVCVPETEDENTTSASHASHGSSGMDWTGSLVANGDQGDAQSAGASKEPQAHHQCTGSCTEVARSCSWAYTGDCLCTASSVPDPWGLFSQHGCVAVIKSQLGGRGLIEIGGNKSSSGSNSSTAAFSDSIVQGSKGFYNASTGAQIACPCNATCVSYGCCGSNGMTFEPHDTCLGKLDVT